MTNKELFEELFSLNNFFIYRSKNLYLSIDVYEHIIIIYSKFKIFVIHNNKNEIYRRGHPDGGPYHVEKYRRVYKVSDNILNKILSHLLDHSLKYKLGKC